MVEGNAKQRGLCVICLSCCLWFTGPGLVTPRTRKTNPRCRRLQPRASQDRCRALDLHPLRRKTCRFPSPAFSTEPLWAFPFPERVGRQEGSRLVNFIHRSEVQSAACVSPKACSGPFTFFRQLRPTLASRCSILGPDGGITIIGNGRDYRMAVKAAAPIDETRNHQVRHHNHTIMFLEAQLFGSSSSSNAAECCDSD